MNNKIKASRDEGWKSFEVFDLIGKLFWHFEPLLSTYSCSSCKFCVMNVKIFSKFISCSTPHMCIHLNVKAHKLGHLKLTYIENLNFLSLSYLWFNRPNFRHLSKILTIISEPIPKIVGKFVGCFNILRVKLGQINQEEDSKAAFKIN